jgi:DNA-binding NtrC family response regulator
VQELSLRSQAKLLRVLTAGQVRRLGGTTPYALDVRFIASADRFLRREVEGGAFRADLYYRLSSVEVVLPPLRERGRDLVLLAEHFLGVHARRLERPVPRLDGEARQALENYGWPGNVRELETLLLRVLLHLSRADRITLEDLRPFLNEGQRGQPEQGGESKFFREALFKGRDLKELKLELERAYVTSLFREKQGNLQEMMKRLGLKRTQLYALFRKVGLDVKTLRGMLRL